MAQAIVPALRPFEVANVLRTAERRSRRDAAAQAVFLERLRLLPIAVEHRPATWLAQQILPMARKYHLSAYDAPCLELAIREGLPLATLDGELREAASAAGVGQRWKWKEIRWKIGSIYGRASHSESSLCQ
ncbi:MAG: type II toxin-antitoxin system VapC family toxin [Bryobacteraceae bacterium]